MDQYENQQPQYQQPQYQPPQPQYQPPQQPQYQPQYQQPQYPQQPQYQQPQYPQQPQYQPQYQQPVNTGLQQPNLLVFGILSLALSVIVGIILGAIGRKKGKEFIAQGGTLTGASKVGFILCKVGLILSIIATVFFVIYMIILIIAGASMNYYYSYY